MCRGAWFVIGMELKEHVLRNRDMLVSMLSGRGLRRGACMFLCCSLGACGDSGDGSVDAAGSGAGGISSMGGDGDSLAAPSGCEGVQTDETSCIGVVTGKVIDSAGAGVAELDVTVCGPTCFRGTTDESGMFEIELNAYVVVSEYSVQPHGTPNASTFYYPLPTDLPDGDYDSGELRVVELPSDGGVFVTKLELEADAVSPQQTLTSGDVSVSLAEGTVIRLSIIDGQEGEEGRRFRASELSETQMEHFAPSLMDSRVFALGPFEARLTGPDSMPPEVSLSVQNSLDWAADSEVEVLALGTYLADDWITPSSFERVGVATVSSDGESIVLDAGGAPGISYLTWLAMRPLP